ncbi:MAG: hypothetical protein V4602_07015 [Pseudomonadota bacterium]
MMSPIRRTVSLICASGLLIGGIVFVGFHFLYSPVIYGKMLMGGGLLIGLGGWWLYSDFIDATPNS